MNVRDRTIKFHHITSSECAHRIKFPKFTSCTVSRSSNKMQRSLRATSCEKWYQHFYGSYRHASLDSQVHHTFQDAPPHLPMSSKKHVRCFIFKRKKSVVMILINFKMTPWHSVPFFIGAFSFSPSLPEQERLHISIKAGYICYIRIILQICIHIIYLSIHCIFGSSNQLGLVVGSQLGLFVVSSLGAKHGAFHSEDETQKVGSSGGQGRAEEGEGDSETQKDIKTTQLG